MMFNPSIMTEHGGHRLDLPRAAVPPLHALSDFDEVWQFPDATSMVAAMRANYAEARAARAFAADLNWTTDMERLRVQ